jgi:phosphoribosyl-ATP pyrophosphohydrolase
MSLNRDTSETMSAVWDWYEQAGLPIRSELTASIPAAESDLILALLFEESSELRDAIENADARAIADALADIAYVVFGAALQFGVDLDEVLRRVHVSNLTKVGPDGSVSRNHSGKIVAGAHYKRPDLEDLGAIGLDQTKRGQRR